jgi:hypothetical protein
MQLLGIDKKHIFLAKRVCQKVLMNKLVQLLYASLFFLVNNCMLVI